jgi:hypothetical protein
VNTETYLIGFNTLKEITAVSTLRAPEETVPPVIYVRDLFVPTAVVNVWAET